MRNLAKFSGSQIGLDRIVAARVGTAAQILNFAFALRFTRATAQIFKFRLVRYALRLACAAARNFTKFNQAAVNFKILSTQSTLMRASCERGIEFNARSGK